jgi:hypothetical protein
LKVKEVDWKRIMCYYSHWYYFFVSENERKRGAV